MPRVRQMLSTGNVPLTRVEAGAFVTYLLLLPAEAVPGSLTLSWTGETAVPPGDLRRLGVAEGRPRGQIKFEGELANLPN